MMLQDTGVVRSNDDRVCIDVPFRVKRSKNSADRNHAGM